MVTATVLNHLSGDEIPGGNGYVLVTLTVKNSSFHSQQIHNHYKRGHLVEIFVNVSEALVLVSTCSLSNK